MPKEAFMPEPIVLVQSDPEICERPGSIKLGRNIASTFVAAGVAICRRELQPTGG